MGRNTYIKWQMQDPVLKKWMKKNGVSSTARNEVQWATHGHQLNKYIVFEFGKPLTPVSLLHFNLGNVMYIVLVGERAVTEEMTKEMIKKILKGVSFVCIIEPNFKQLVERSPLPEPCKDRLNAQIDHTFERARQLGPRRTWVNVDGGPTMHVVTKSTMKSLRVHIMKESSSVAS